MTLLDEGNGGQVLVRQADNDIFVVGMAEAIRACRAVDQAAEFAEQFGELLTRLEGWLDVHRARIKTANLNFRDHDLLFLVQQRREAFDQELTDALVELDIEIANDQRFSLVSLNVLAVPCVSADCDPAFLASGQTFEHAG